MCFLKILSKILSSKLSQICVTDNILGCCEVTQHLLEAGYHSERSKVTKCWQGNWGCFALASLCLTKFNYNLVLKAQENYLQRVQKLLLRAWYGGVEDNIPLCLYVAGRGAAFLLGYLSTSVAVEPGRLPRNGKAARTHSYHWIQHQ